MKIGVISDTHINDKCEHLPQEVLTAFRQVDMVIHAGDLVSLDALSELKLICPKIIAVAGNMDDAQVNEKFPKKQVINVSGVKIGITHGSGGPANLLELIKDTFKNDNCDVIIFGHSHKAMNEKIGKSLFFNPGSASACEIQDASYGIIEINGQISAKIIKIT